jgi:trigger factor
MKVNVEEISVVKKKVNIEIPEDQVQKEIDSFYAELKQKAKIKGFRPGKVPREILERYFKDYAKGEVLQRLIQDSYPKALSEATLSPVSQPVFDPQDLEIGKPFRYSAVVEIKPDTKVDGYLGLNLEGKKEEVTDEEVQGRLGNLQNLHAQLKTATESRAVRSGDYVILDYEASKDGRPVEEGKGIDVPVEVGGGRFIPGIEEKLIGMKVDDATDIEVSFPEDYGYKKWAGKALTFHVKIKEMKEKILPALDDEFAKDLGDYESLEALKTRLRQDIGKEKERGLDRQLKDQIVDQLLKTNPIEIPSGLVEEQTHALVSDTKARLASQGMALKDLDVTEEKLHGDYGEMAQKQVRTFLILEKIAAQEGITVSDEEVEGRLKEISERGQQKFDAVKRYYEKNGLIPEVKGGILTEKTLSFLLEKASVKYL